MFAKVRGTEISFDVDGVRLAPDGNRTVERPVLFLLHGGPGSDHSFLKSHVVAELRDTAPLVYIGHRDSAAYFAGLSCAGDLVAVFLKKQWRSLERRQSEAAQVVPDAASPLANQPRNPATKNIHSPTPIQSLVSVPCN